MKLIGIIKLQMKKISQGAILIHSAAGCDMSNMYRQPEGVSDKTPDDGNTIYGGSVSASGCGASIQYEKYTLTC